jgi:hypothetical protein
MAGTINGSFRKTVATLIDDEGLSARIGADHLGHTHVSMPQDRYMARGHVHTQVADLLGQQLSPPGDDCEGCPRLLGVSHLVWTIHRRSSRFTMQFRRPEPQQPRAGPKFMTIAGAKGLDETHTTGPIHMSPTRLLARSRDSPLP